MEPRGWVAHDRVSVRRGQRMFQRVMGVGFCGETGVGMYMLGGGSVVGVVWGVGIGMVELIVVISRLETANAKAVRYVIAGRV